MPAPDLRRRLGALSAMAAKTSAAEKRIVEAAAERRGVIQSRLDELRPKAISDAAAGDEYQTLIHERGRLDIVLGR